MTQDAREPGPPHAVLGPYRTYEGVVHALRTLAAHGIEVDCGDGWSDGEGPRYDILVPAHLVESARAILHACGGELLIERPERESEAERRRKARDVEAALDRAFKHALLSLLLPPMAIVAIYNLAVVMQLGASFVTSRWKYAFTLMLTIGALLIWDVLFFELL